MHERIAQFEASLRQETIRHFYLVDELPPELPPHFLWQAPLLFANGHDAIMERAMLAARLWVRNLDLRLHDELLLVHPWFPFTLIAQRARRKGETAQLCGPIPKAVRLVDSKPVPNSALVYKERTRMQVST